MLGSRAVRRELRVKASDSRGVNFATAGLYAAIGLAMLAPVMPGRRAPRDLLLEASDVERVNLRYPRD
jgi:hypothetical protein